MRKQTIDEKILIEAGIEILKTQGIEAVNMRSIACFSNVSLGSIYNYYKDKDELLLAIVKSIWLNITLDMNIETESFQKAVSSLFDSIEEGNRIYQQERIILLPEKSKTIGWKWCAGICTNNRNGDAGCNDM